MKLYIKQKIMSLNDSFSIYNEQGEEVYRVEGKLLSLGKKFHVYDNSGREVLYIEQELLSLLAKYNIFIGDQLAAVVNQKLSLLKPKYSIEGLDWQIKGDYLAHNYTIREDDRAIAVISKAFLAWSDTYEIDILDNDYADVLLGIVIVIDAVMSDS